MNLKRLTFHYLFLLALFLTPLTPASADTTLSSAPDLKLETRNGSVIQIQQYLNSNGYTIDEAGKPGSSGNETNYFGLKTKQALIRYQKDNNITPSNGYFGPKTRAKMVSGNISGKVQGAFINNLGSGSGSGGGDVISFYSLTVSKPATNTGTGLVSSGAGGISCGAACTQLYPATTSVVLVATPDASSTFDGWSGSCTGTGVCTVIMSYDKTVTAIFSKKTDEFSLRVRTVLSNRSSGLIESTVTSSNGIQCGTICTKQSSKNKSVVLRAFPAVGYSFVRWFGDATGVAPTTSVTMNADKQVYAEFVKKAEYTLTVKKAGGGNMLNPETGKIITTTGGTVTSTGINCGTTCTKTYSPNTKVTLTQNTNAMSTFTGWSVSGSNLCTAPSLPCVISMDKNIQVTAHWDQNSCPATLSTSDSTLLDRLGNLLMTRFYGGENRQAVIQQIADRQGLSASEKDQAIDEVRHTCWFLNYQRKF